MKLQILNDNKVIKTLFSQPIHVTSKLQSKKKIPYYEKLSFLEFVLPHSRHMVTNESLSIISDMLTPEIENRPNASTLLEHEFFRKFSYKN